MPSPKDGKLLYHLTHLDNMDSILELGLMSRNTLSRVFTDVANPEIIAGRREYNVDLGDYVPFHFYVKNPFDLAVCRRFGAENMAIIAIWRPRGDCAGYYVVPNHPLSGSPEFLPYQEGFEQVNWQLLENNGERHYTDPDIRHACMAECDVDRVIQPREFAFVYVKTEEARDRILALPHGGLIGDRLQVNSNMFPRELG